MEAHFGAEHFDKVAATYESGSTNRTTNFARDLIALVPPISQTSIVLDNASGPEIITGEILKQSVASDPPPHIYATNISPAMIQILRKKN